MLNDRLILSEAQLGDQNEFIVLERGSVQLGRFLDEFLMVRIHEHS